MKKLIALLFAPYVVTAEWGGKWHHHHAWTMVEAMEWARCYPVTKVAIACDGRGIIKWRM